MIALKPEQYVKLITPLKQVKINHIFALTVLENKVNGNVFVDNVKAPSAALICHPYGMSLVFGTSNNKAFNNEVLKYMLNHQKKRESNEWLQMYLDEGNEFYEDILGDRFIDSDMCSSDYQNSNLIVRDTRVNFKFNQSLFEKVQKKSSCNYNLVRTSAKYFDEITGTVIPKYFWKDGTHFASEGVGYSVLVDDIPVATCFSAYTTDNKIELGIETNAQYQHKGLAQLVATAMIRHCISNKIEPVWACRYSNKPSYNLATKLGFEVTCKIPYYCLLCNVH